MSPTAARLAARRLVGTVVVLTTTFPLLAAVASTAVDGAAGPAWWAAIALAGFAAALAALARAVVRGADPDPPTACLVGVGALSVLVQLLVVHRAAGSTAAWPLSGTTTWPTYLVGATPPALGALVRRWRAPAAAPVVVALAAVLAAVGQVPDPLRDDIPDRVVYGAGLSIVGMAVFFLTRGVERSSSRLRTARMAVLRAEAEAEALALAESERGRWEAAVHDDVLTALRAGASARTAQEVSAAAAAATAALEHLAAPPSTLTVDAARAAQQVGAAAHGVHPGAAVDLSSGSGVLPGRVVEALADATAELLRNTVRHNRPGVRADVRGTLSGSGTRVVVSDDGAGFDVEAVPPGRLGIRVSVVGRLRSVGGDAAVTSTPERGTSVELRWPR